MELLAQILCHALENGNVRVTFPDVSIERLFSFDIKLRRHIYLVGDIFSVFLPLTDALRQQIFYLPVYGAEIVLRPRGDGGVKLRR